MTVKYIKPEGKTCDYGCGSENLFWSVSNKKWVCGSARTCPNHKNYRKKLIFDLFGVENVSQLTVIKEKKKRTCLQNLGVDHPSKSENIKNKKKETCLSNYGVENPGQSVIIQERMKQTRLEKYGVEHHMQNEDIKNRVFDTNEKKTGYRYPSQNPESIEKRTKTYIANYGVDNPNKSPKIKNKIKETCIIKYGVSSPSQSPEIQDKKMKSSFRSKEYIFPSGKKENIQGYEGMALDWLLQNGFEENDIILGARNIPTFWYNFKNKKRRYFPDIFVPSRNLIIEVKSPWTYERYLEINLLKEKEVVSHGYKFEFIIVDKYNNINIVSNI